MGRTVYVPRDALDVVYVALDADEDGDFVDLDDLLSYYAHSFGLRWPTMHPLYPLYPLYHREYIGSEGRILTENRLCRIGASSYGALLAIWIVPQEDAPAALAERWARSIGPTFAQYGTHALIGHASNGEAFFRQIENA